MALVQQEGKKLKIESQKYLYASHKQHYHRIA